jgi:hypothetical protein
MKKECLVVLSYDIWLHLIGYLRHWSGMHPAYVLEGTQIPTTWMETIKQRGVQTLLEMCGAFIPLLIWSYSLKELAIPLTFIAARGLTRRDPQGTCDIGKDSTSKFGEYSTDSQFGTSYLHSVEDGAS